MQTLPPVSISYSYFLRRYTQYVRKGAKNRNKVYSMNRYLLSVIILTVMMSGQIMSGKSAVCRPLLVYLPQWLGKRYAQSGDSMKKNFLPQSSLVGLRLPIFAA